MEEHRCPRCGAYSVRRTDSAFAAVTIVELECASCHHEEELRSDAADFTTRLERWRGRPIIPIYDYADDLVDVD